MNKMSKKFSIIRTLDLDKLNEEIDEYMLVNDESPYIFMNDETIYAIKKELNTIPTHIPTSIAKQPPRYCNCKIFPDNTLGFGEVEIR